MAKVTRLSDTDATPKGPAEAKAQQQAKEAPAPVDDKKVDHNPTKSEPQKGTVSRGGLTTDPEGPPAQPGEDFHYPGGEAQYNADQAAIRKGEADPYKTPDPAD